LPTVCLYQSKQVFACSTCYELEKFSLESEKSATESNTRWNQHLLAFQMRV